MIDQNCLNAGAHHFKTGSVYGLHQLQQTTEAQADYSPAQKNFRRMVEQQALVEETGQSTAAGAGRPAKLFRFRRNVVMERAIAGNKLPLARG